MIDLVLWIELNDLCSWGISWRQGTMFYSPANLGYIKLYVRVHDFAMRFHFY